MVGCQRCGAGLEVPLDLAATTVRCNYCGHTTPIPAEMMNARRQERMARMAATTPQVNPPPPSSNLWMVWVALPVGLAIAIGVLVPILAATGSATTTTTMTTFTPPKPAPTPNPNASDAKSHGQTRTTELMKQLYDKGCKNVIMPPERARGDTKLDTKLVANNATCVRVLVVTGSADNKLTLTMKTPFGEELKTPPASGEVDFTYCPKQSGPHPTHITATTEEFYMVAAVECPKSLAGQ
jgi:hypothetical protein